MKAIITLLGTGMRTQPTTIVDMETVENLNIMVRSMMYLNELQNGIKYNDALIRTDKLVYLLSTQKL